MKKLTVLLLAATSIGCGVAQSLSESCQGSDIEMGCNTVFGYTDSEFKESTQQRLKDLEAAVTSLKQQVVYNVQLIELHTLQLLNLNSSTTNLESQTQNLTTEISSLQSEVNEALVDIAELQNSESVKEVIDPCGDGPGYDEVILRTRSGKLLVYFRSGANEFLTLLVPGNYQTTDGTNCAFTVNSQLKVCTNQGCI